MLFAFVLVERDGALLILGWATTAAVMIGSATFNQALLRLFRHLFLRYFSKRSTGTSASDDP
jgi:hypothetical protein